MVLLFSPHLTHPSLHPTSFLPYHVPRLPYQLHHRPSSNHFFPSSNYFPRRTTSLVELLPSSNYFPSLWMALTATNGCLSVSLQWPTPISTVLSSPEGTCCLPRVPAAPHEDLLPTNGSSLRVSAPSGEQKLRPAALTPCPCGEDSAASGSGPCQSQLLRG
jgi:hypothetical protein